MPGSLRIPLQYPNNAPRGYPSRQDGEVYFVTPPGGSEACVEVPGDDEQQSADLLAATLAAIEKGRPFQIEMGTVVGYSAVRELSYVRDKYLQDHAAVAEKWEAAGRPRTGAVAEEIARELVGARVPVL
jgi:hypothetical protein